MALALLHQLVRMVPALGLALVIDKVATSHATATLVVILSGLALLALLEPVLAAGRDAVMRDLAERIAATTPSPEREPRRGDADHVAVELLLAVLTIPILLAAMLAALALAAPAFVVVAALGMAAPILAARFDRPARTAASDGARQAGRELERWRSEARLALAVNGDDRWREDVRQRSASLEARDRQAEAALDRHRRRQRRRDTLVKRLTAVALLGIGARAIVDGALTAGGLIAALLVLRQMQSLIDSGLGLLRRAEDLAPAASPPVAAATVPPPSDPPAIAGAAIVLRDVVWRGDGQRAAALRVSLDIEPGSFVAVTGGPGAGKSLLLALIAGCLAPQTGAVLRAPPRLAPLALVAQDPVLPDTTIAEAVLPGATTATHESRLAALRRADALDAVRALPLGLAQPTGPQGRALSSTLRRRIALARALAVEPRILLIDALPDALEAAAAAELLASLQPLRGATTIVVATARPDWLAAADRVVELRGGRVAMDAAPRAPVARDARIA